MSARSHAFRVNLIARNGSSSRKSLFYSEKCVASYLQPPVVCERVKIMSRMTVTKNYTM